MPTFSLRHSFRIALVATLAVFAPIHDATAQDRPPERRCESTTLPKQLPAADAVVDSATLLSVLSELLNEDGEGLLVSMRYLDGATTPALTVLTRKSVSADSADRLLDVLRPNLKPITLDQRNWGVRLRVIGGSTPTVALERSLYCPPDPIARPERASVTRRVETTREGMNQLRGNQSRRPQQIDAELTIAADGSVTNVQMRKGSGLADLDAEIVVQMRQRQYRPATLDGVPIPSWERSNGMRLRM